MNPIALKVKDLNVTYGDLQALDAVTFDLPSGSCCALVGMNGAGKTTLFKSIMGFIKPDGGSITIDGDDLEAAQKASKISFMPQAEEIDWHFPISARDVVMTGRYSRMGITRRAREIDRKAVATALERVEMSELADRQIGALSGGQRKRVFLARALAQDPTMIMLDEPFAGVDSATEGRLLEVLSELQQGGATVLVATHNLGSVSSFCDHAILVSKRLIAAGPIDEAFTDENLERTFGGRLRSLGKREGAS